MNEQILCVIQSTFVFFATVESCVHKQQNTPTVVMISLFLLINTQYRDIQTTIKYLLFGPKPKITLAKYHFSLLFEAGCVNIETYNHL